MVYFKLTIDEFLADSTHPSVHTEDHIAVYVFDKRSENPCPTSVYTKHRISFPLLRMLGIISLSHLIELIWVLRSPIGSCLILTRAALPHTTISACRTITYEVLVRFYKSTRSVTSL
jgi:hypothetical protein